MTNEDFDFEALFCIDNCINLEHKMAKHGQVVEYTHNTDSSPAPVPNTSAAIITKVHNSPVPGVPTKVDLRVFTSTGDFIAQGILRGAPGVRGTWHPHLS